MNTADSVRIADLGAVRLAYRVWGAEEALPLVLLHSLGDRSETWEGFATSVSDTYRVIAPDLRGHGLSSRTASYSIDHMAGDILELIDALGLDRVRLVGHSLGAMVAYVLAPANPTRTARMVLEEPPAPVPPRPPRPVPTRMAIPCDWLAVEEVYEQRKRS